ncbi:YidB family protein [Cupriavidus sp. PET2-C1]
MGLLDSVLGGVLGQRGSGEAGAGGLNPKMMMALGLLAMLAMRHKGGDSSGGAAQDPASAGAGGLGGLGGLLGGLMGGGAAGGAPGGLDLGGLLGGLLGGQAGGAPELGAAAAGIGALQQVLAQAGLGEQVNSWIGTGANQPVSPSALASALGGTGALESLAEKTGLSQDDVAAHLSEGLPELIDKLTPQGQVPPAA